MESKYVDEIKRHISVVIEDVHSKVKIIAEGVSALNDRMERVEGRLGALDERTERIEGRLGGLEARVERGFAETQAMIKFSYAELDRRVSALEGVVAELASRVQKLEIQ